MEYFHRDKQYSFVGLDSRRSKLDKYGNKWSLDNRKDLIGIETLANAYGYDPENPPYEDYILLHCQPNQGAYDIACVDLEKAQEAYRKAQSKVIQYDGLIEEFRGKQDQVEKLARERDVEVDAKNAAATLFHQCKAVIENAVQRFYLVPIDSFERMDLYGMPVHCQELTLTPQKKHLALPVVTIQEPVVAPQYG